MNSQTAVGLLSLGWEAKELQISYSGGNQRHGKTTSRRPTRIITVAWTPKCSSIKGNETANGLTKEGAEELKIFALSQLLRMLRQQPNSQVTLSGKTDGISQKGEGPYSSFILQLISNLKPSPMSTESLNLKQVMFP